MLALCIHHDRVAGIRRIVLKTHCNRHFNIQLNTRFAKVCINKLVTYVSVFLKAACCSHDCLFCPFHITHPGEL